MSLFRCLFLAAVMLTVMGAVPVRQVAALAGQKTCPLMTDTTSMSAWCTDRFGGYGGTLTASAWDRGHRTFECICNANPDAAITVTRRSSSQQLSRPTGARRDVGGTLASMFFGEAEDLVGDANEIESSLSTSSSMMSSFPEDESSSSSSSTEESSSSSDSTVNGTCAWSGTFTAYPDGVQCMATTGLCPASCSVIPSNLCNSPLYPASETCSSPSAYVVSYTCLTCGGRNYTISSTALDNCTRFYTAADTCDPQSACGGHGCCGDASASAGGAATCTCLNDGTNGYYTGSSCNTCQSGYDRNSAGLCLIYTNKVQIILASIAKTWTMVAPNMAVLFLFVIFSVTRKLNASDRPFDLTGLRRANLSTVQVARRRQQSLFHSKYIPMRPAKSRSFANPHQPQVRGPPAF